MSLMAQRCDKQFRQLTPDASGIAEIEYLNDGNSLLKVETRSNSYIHYKPVHYHDTSQRETRSEYRGNQRNMANYQPIEADDVRTLGAGRITS
jgi:uncharacterized membrane protein YgaE (UPF0421/DUF939 family)